MMMPIVISPVQHTRSVKLPCTLDSYGYDHKSSTACRPDENDWYQRKYHSWASSVADNGTICDSQLLMESICRHSATDMFAFKLSDRASLK